MTLTIEPSAHLVLSGQPCLDLRHQPFEDCAPLVRLSAVSSGVSVRGVPLAEVVLSGPPDAAQAGEFGGAQDGVWHGFRGSPKGGIRQGYSISLRNFYEIPLSAPAGEARRLLPSGGAATERKRGSGLRPLPHFSFRRSTSRGPSGPLEHPPKRVRQGKSRQARAQTRRGRRGLVPPPLGLISSSRQRGGSP